jgi:hypothetical protein
MRKQQQPSSMDDTKISEIIHHHNRTKISVQDKLDWWVKESGPAGRRCPNCWLMHNICFCSTITSMRQRLKNNKTLPKSKVIMYYHFSELGRSINTAHFFECLYRDRLSTTDDCSYCERLIFAADNIRELQLLHEINEEMESGELQTCILYLTNSSESLSAWGNRQSLCSTKPARIVALGERLTNT